MMDALGFKGIWRRSPGEPDRAEAVLAKMKRLRAVTQNVRIEKGTDGPVAMRCECISDTIVLGLWPNSPPATPQVPFIFASQFIRVLCQEALREPPVLAYRGAVAYGRFEMEDGFVIGPAVDEAAESMELADGAFIWFTPSALARVEDGVSGGLFAHKYAVPFKGGATFETFVLVPWLPGSADRGAEAARALLETFDSRSLSVAIKRQNTKRFFDAAIADARAKEAEFARIMALLPPELRQRVAPLT